MALRTPTAEAEAIKTRHGVRCASSRTPTNDRGCGIGDRAPRVMSRQTLAEVIEPRAESFFLVQQGAARSRATRSCCRPGSCSPAAAR
jgi:cell division protein FtsA